MAMRSKDDTFVEQISSSAANAAPPLFQAPSEQSIPDPEPSNRPDENGEHFIPLLVDTWIRDAILKPVTKEGYVYILKAPKYFEENYPGEQPRVKIGIALDVDKRNSDLKNDCGPFDLQRVGDREDIKFPLYYKVEELVRTERAREFQTSAQNVGSVGPGRARGQRIESGLRCQRR